MSSTELSPAPLTWKDVLGYIDACLTEMAHEMDKHPEYGQAIQERMAVLMYRRMHAVEMANRERLSEGNKVNE